jgi:hypothetical protein
LSIENLIGETIEKLSLPSAIGEGPDYQPHHKKNNNFESGLLENPFKKNNSRRN